MSWCWRELKELHLLRWLPHSLGCSNGTGSKLCGAVEGREQFNWQLPLKPAVCCALFRMRKQNVHGAAVPCWSQADTAWRAKWGCVAATNAHR